jgi:hypothetical protein
MVNDQTHQGLNMTASAFPQASVLEERLQRIAIEIGDPTQKAFRVDLVRVHGGKPPVYSVVIRSPAKEPIRMKLEEILNRRLTCGISSFMLKADEAQRIVLTAGAPS